MWGPHLVVRGLIPDDIATLERLYREYRVRAFALAWRLLGDRQLAEDAMHQAFVQIISSVLGGETHALEFEGITVLRNTRWAAIRILQKKKMRAEAEKQFGRESLNPGIEDWVQAEARVLCEDVLRRLPRPYIEVLRARYINQEPDDLAARRLGLAIGAYRSRLQRAMIAARRSAQRSGLSGRRGLAALFPVLSLPHLRPAPATGRGRRVFPVPPAALVASSVVVGGVLLGPAPAPPVASHATPATVAPESMLTSTPADVLIYSAATALGDPRQQTVVAVGVDARCNCEVLLRTTTGGRTWETAPGPEAASLLTLPPAYPRDPRIFVSGATADVMAAGFGQSFVALPVASGPLALDPAFDGGRAYAYVGTHGGVWRVAIGNAAAVGAPRQLTSSNIGDISAVTTTRSRRGGVLVLSHRGSQALLTECSAAPRCTQLSPGPGAPVDELTVGTDAGTSSVVVAYRWTGTLLVSRDGGHLFTAIPLPAGATSIAGLAVASSIAGQPTLWVTVNSRDGVRLLVLPGLGGPWQSPSSHGEVIIRSSGVLVPLGPGRLLDLFSGGDVLCITADGMRWAGCPVTS